MDIDELQAVLERKKWEAAFKKKQEEEMMMKSSMEMDSMTMANNPMMLMMRQQMAMMRVGQALEKSSEIMAIMNKAVKLDAIGQTMRELAKEMETAGIIDELVDEAFADMDDEDAEEEGQFAIEQVLATCLASLTRYPMHTGGNALLGMGADDEHIEQVMAELGLEAAGELPLDKTTEPARAPGRAEPAQAPALRVLGRNQNHGYSANTVTSREHGAEHRA